MQQSLGSLLLPTHHEIDVSPIILGAFSAVLLPSLCEQQLGRHPRRSEAQKVRTGTHLSPFDLEKRILWIASHRQQTFLGLRDTSFPQCNDATGD
jgi:hypothetical protein